MFAGLPPKDSCVTSNGLASDVFIWETPRMRKMFSKMWNDDAGIVALEYLLVASILGMALVVGLSTVSVAINAELTELANAILAIDQGYSVVSQSTCDAFKSGSTVTGSAYHIGYGNSLTAVTPIGNQSSGTGVTVCP